MQVGPEISDLLINDPEVQVAQVAATLGISVRTLHYYSQKQLGMSAGRYMKMVRLLRVRMALLHADPARSSVTAIAVAFGFAELGRSSVAYRRVFGETPSQTLRGSQVAQVHWHCQRRRLPVGTCLCRNERASDARSFPCRTLPRIALLTACR
jgi:AraC-like DNA-binding protein